MKLLLVSEGPSDVAEIAADKGHGALHTLVRRVLGEKFGREVQPHEVTGQWMRRLHRGGGFREKTDLAIREASRLGYDAVAIVIDRDGRPGSDRLQRMRVGREDATGAGAALAARTALGLAIETIEAWLLADEWAVNEALAPRTPAQRCNPESLRGKKGTSDHPKVRFAILVESATIEVESAHDAVARVVRLDVLEAQCPQGFLPFADELRTRCG